METTNQMYPLRINHYTTILVPKEKCNDEYRQAYISKHGKPASLAMPLKENPHPTKEELKELAEKGLTIKQAAEQLGYKPSTVLYYNNKYMAGLRKVSNNRKNC